MQVAFLATKSMVTALDGAHAADAAASDEAIDGGTYHEQRRWIERRWV